MTHTKKIMLCFMCFLIVSCSSQADNTTSNNNDNLDDQSEDNVWTSLAAGDWNVIWEGYGSVTFSNGIILEPQAPISEDETHAALVLHQPTLDEPISDFSVTVTYTLNEQLRSDAPNTWETFWLFFNTTYDETENDVTANYFIVKTNGIELGIAGTADSQTFLYTDDAPVLDEGDTATLTLVKVDQELSVSVDGDLLFTYDGAAEDPLLDTAGTIGLYTEDAKITVRSIRIEAL